MIKTVFLSAIALSMAFAISCGNPGNSKKKQIDPQEQAAYENAQIKELSDRMEVLDSLISAFNETVSQDLKIEPLSIDINYLKMLHGEKFEEQLRTLQQDLKNKEASVTTLIRANKIMPHDE